MKKFLSLLLILSLMLMGSAYADLTESGLPICTDGDAELDVMCFMSAAQADYATSYHTQWLEERTGVHINFIVCNNNEWNTNFQLSLASEDYPDIYCGGFGTNTIVELSSAGVIIPLEDAIEAYAPNLTALLEENPDIRKAITAPDGHIYAFPTIRSQEAEDTYMYKTWVYNDWLEAYTDATGNGMPETTDEYKDMLIYFRDNDMNGNGDPTDEIPLTGTYSRESNDPFYYFMNGFCYCTSSFVQADEDGNVTTMATSDEFREGLMYLNDLYNEGLLYEGTYTQSLTQFRAMTSVSPENVIIGAAAAGYPMRLVTPAEGLVQYLDYTAVPPVTGPNGYHGTPAGYANQVTMNNIITSACEDVELAVRWLDDAYSAEGKAWYTYGGVEGVDWEWVDEPSFGGGERSVKRLTARENETYLSYVIPVVTDRAVFDSNAASDTPTSTTLCGLLAIKDYETDAVMTGFPPTVWCMDEDLIQEMSELKTQVVTNGIITYVDKFILGVLDIHDDQVWADYIQELEDRGLEQYLTDMEIYYFGK